MRRQAIWAFFIVAFALVLFSTYGREIGWFHIAALMLIIVGMNDMRQKRHAIRRNFPIFGHFRYIFESIRPEINQYFIESNIDGAPFNRETRSVIYQRAKNQRDSLPFGTRHNLYEEGSEFLQHSMFPTKLDPSCLRVRVGGPACLKPYDASVFMISAMSFGALSARAVEAMSLGAKLGGFAMNTGEGGASSYHLSSGGDLTWQIGTGYFGCRKGDGTFDETLFTEVAQLSQIKMIELKLSQGAKPGLGGLLPAAKVTEEIAKTRGIPMGKDSVSPARHSAFQDHKGLLHFIDKLRHLSGGKPVGIKFCLGNPTEFMDLCRTMLEEGIAPDFVTVDGAEGGTGAAPVEFSNHVGFPLMEGLVQVRNILVGFGLKQNIRIFCSGKIATGYDVVKAMALGADVCASARGMMLALGCIQALRCDSNKCPTGIATQDPGLMSGIVVDEKAARIASFHEKTLKSVSGLMGAMGVAHTSELKPEHIWRRGNDGVIRNYAEIYPFVAESAFLTMRSSSQSSFAHKSNKGD